MRSQCPARPARTVHAEERRLLQLRNLLSNGARHALERAALHNSHAITTRKICAFATGEPRAGRAKLLDVPSC